MLAKMPGQLLSSPLKSGLAFLAVCFLFFLITGCLSQTGDVSSVGKGSFIGLEDRLMSHREGVMVVAHRACWRKAPENSIAAIDACVDMQVDMVEIDVRRTRDGHLVIIHDDTVDRTTNGSGSVRELDLSEVTSLSLRGGLGGDDADLTEHRIPTLEQALIAARGKILVNLDAKDDVRDDAYATAESLGMANEVLIKMTMTDPGDVDLDSTSFFGNTHFMPIIKQKNGPLGKQVSSFQSTEEVAFEVIYGDETQLKAACRSAASQGSRCWVNTMWENLSPGHSDDISVTDPDNHWGHLVRLGVNMIQTDRPAALIEYLATRGYR